MAKIEHLLGTSTPARKFRYAKDTKVLTIWWEKKDTTTGRKKLHPYLYLGVPLSVVKRLRAINVPLPLAKVQGAATGRAPSVGTFINTKLKKYPSINLTATDEDVIVEAKRVSQEVRTRSTKKSPKNKAVGDFLKENLLKKGRS